MSDELRSRLGRLAETHDIAPLTADEVIARRRAGVNRQRLLAVAALVVLVLGVAGVIAVTGDDSGVDVAAEGDPGTVVEGPDADGANEGGGDIESDAGSATVPTTTAAFFDDATGTSAAASDLGGSDWVVAWGDGFFHYGQEFVPSDTTLEDLVPDIRDRLPAEIIDVVEAAGAVTLAEQIEAVTEAGLLDEATEIFSADPELLDAFAAVQAGGTWRPVAEVSTDGETWTELVDFALPSGNPWVQWLASDGTHLVVVDQSFDERGSVPVTVSITADLESWTVVEIPAGADDVPDFAQQDTFASGLAIGADGWYLTVTDTAFVDLWSLIPDDVIDEIGDRGFGVEATPEGVVVTVYDEVWAEPDWVDDAGVDTAPASTTTVPATTVPATTAPAETTIPFGADDGADLAGDDVAADIAVPEPWPGGEAEVLTVIPWDDFPFTFEEYREFEFGSQTVRAWQGGFDGSLEEATPPATEGCCTVIGTDAGFLAQTWDGPEAALSFSADGESWNPVTLPDGVEWINSVAAVVDGVVLVDDAGTIWRGDADGSNWVEADVPGIPSSVFLWFADRGGRGVATIVDVAVHDWAEPAPFEPEPVVSEIRFEHDGFEIFIRDEGNDTGTVVITDLATGEVVLDERGQSTDDDLPPFIEMSDDENSFIFLDETGEVIVTVPLDVISDTWSAAEGDAVGSVVVEPGFEGADWWLVASADGIDWLVEDLPDGEIGFGGQAAVNGDTVVVRSGGGWQRFTIG